MHELSLCESIVRIVCQKAAAEGMSQVVSIELTIGEWAGVSDEALLFCFPSVSQGTLAEGASLVFKTTPDNAMRVSSFSGS